MDHVVVLVVFLVAGVANPPMDARTGGDYNHLRMPAHGTVYKGMLYGFFDDEWVIKNKDGGSGRGRASPDLEGIPLASIARKNWKPYPFQLGGYNCRHHVGFHALWFSNSTSFLNKWEFDRIQEIADSILKPTDAMGRNMIISGIPLFRLMAKDPNGQSAAFDNVPISKNSCKTFLLLKKAKKFEIWDTQGVVFQNPGPYKTRTELKNPESMDSSFLDHFHAFIRKNNYYFITQSGKLYIAPPPKKGEKSRKMTALWDDPTRPINAIIEDADRDKVFLFAKHKTDAKRGYYFEMKSATTFETFDPTKLKRVNIEGRAKTLLELWPLVGPQAKKKTSRK